jgi:predicted GIY-YIG superfamily endonuclease
MMDSFLKKRIRSMGNAKDKNCHFVYVINHKKLFYYGITCNDAQREFSHYKSIYELISFGTYKLPIGETKVLNIHKRIASDIVKSKFKCKSNLEAAREYKLNLTIIGTYKTKEEALSVERFLIKSASKNKNCLNSLGRQICH